jgi:hypothetical protein
MQCGMISYNGALFQYAAWPAKMPEKDAKYLAAAGAPDMLRTRDAQVQDRREVIGIQAHGSIVRLLAEYESST